MKTYTRSRRFRKIYLNLIHYNPYFCQCQGISPLFTSYLIIYFLYKRKSKIVKKISIHEIKRDIHYFCLIFREMQSVFDFI